MLRSAQPSQISTYPIHNIDIPDLAVLKYNKFFVFGKNVWKIIKKGGKQIFWAPPAWSRWQTKQYRQ